MKRLEFDFSDNDTRRRARNWEQKGVQCYKEEGSVANHLELIACETVESKLRKTMKLSKRTYGSSVRLVEKFQILPEM